jgi:hypothetical protein
LPSPPRTRNIAHKIREGKGKQIIYLPRSNNKHEDSRNQESNFSFIIKMAKTKTSVTEFQKIMGVSRIRNPYTNQNTTPKEKTEIITKERSEADLLFHVFTT